MAPHANHAAPRRHIRGTLRRRARALPARSVATRNPQMGTVGKCNQCNCANFTESGESETEKKICTCTHNWIQHVDWSKPFGQEKA